MTRAWEGRVLPLEDVQGLEEQMSLAGTIEFGKVRLEELRRGERFLE